MKNITEREAIRSAGCSSCWWIDGKPKCSNECRSFDRFPEIVICVQPVNQPDIAAGRNPEILDPAYQSRCHV